MQVGIERTHREDHRAPQEFLLVTGGPPRFAPIRPRKMRMKAFARFMFFLKVLKDLVLSGRRPAIWGSFPRLVCPEQPSCGFGYQLAKLVPLVCGQARNIIDL